jgi:hypothetical protein
VHGWKCSSPIILLPIIINTRTASSSSQICASKAAASERREEFNFYIFTFNTKMDPLPDAGYINDIILSPRITITMHVV